MRRAGFAIVCLALAGCRSEKPAGCAKDTDCKGKRICVEKKCVYPEDREKETTKRVKQTTAPDAGKPKISASAPSRPSPPVSPPTVNPPGGSFGPSASSPPKKGMFGSIEVKVCRDGKCQELDQVMRSNPHQLFQLFGTMMGHGSGVGKKGKPKPDVKLQICSGGHCMDMGPGFGTNPRDLFRMLGMVGGLLGRRLGGSGGIFSPRLPTKKRTGRRDPPRKVTYRSAKGVLDAASSAVGKVAELKELVPTVVRDRQLVLKAKQGILIVLDVPTSKRSLLSRLAPSKTSKLTVRFYVTEPPLAKLIRGELISIE